jgi:hypothetical protein
MKSTAVCLRCGNPALTVFEVSATMGDTRLRVTEETAICSACMVEAAAAFEDWLRGPRGVRQTMRLTGERAVPLR